MLVFNETSQNGKKFYMKEKRFSVEQIVAVELQLAVRNLMNKNTTWPVICT